MDQPFAFFSCPALSACLRAWEAGDLGTAPGSVWSGFITNHPKVAPEAQQELAHHPINDRSVRVSTISCMHNTATYMALF